MAPFSCPKVASWHQELNLSHSEVQYPPQSEHRMSVTYVSAQCACSLFLMDSHVSPDLYVSMCILLLLRIIKKNLFTPPLGRWI